MLLQMLCYSVLAREVRTLTVFTITDVIHFLPCLLHAGFWKTSGCVLYRKTLQHEQKQSRQPVLQCGSRRLHFHSFKTLPELEAHWLWSSGNCLVSKISFFVSPVLNFLCIIWWHLLVLLTFFVRNTYKVTEGFWWNFHFRCSFAQPTAD